MSAPRTQTEAQPPPSSGPGTPLPASQPASQTQPATGPLPGAAAPGARPPQGASSPLYPFSPQSRSVPTQLPVDFVFPGTEGLSVSEIFSGPGYQAPRPRTSPMAVAAFVCSLVLFIPGPGLVAVGLGWYALRRLRTTIATGDALARFAIVLGSISSAAWLWLSILIGASAALA